jgi:RNA polymerase sigma-70 factor (ECF subfamily)
MATPPDALDAVAARDVSRAVEVAMGTLPPEQREAIVLKEYEGLTFAEIAGALGIPVSTVKTRLYRGLSHLREQLEARGIRPAAVIAAPAP